VNSRAAVTAAEGVARQLAASAAGKKKRTALRSVSKGFLSKIGDEGAATLLSPAEQAATDALLDAFLGKAAEGQTPRPASA